MIGKEITVEGDKPVIWVLLPEVKTDSATWSDWFFSINSIGSIISNRGIKYFIILSSEARSLYFIGIINEGASCPFLKQFQRKTKIFIQQGIKVWPLQSKVANHLIRTDVSYLPNAVKDRRSAIIGCGSRSLLGDKFQKIYPHAYDIPSFVDNKHGNSLKAGRHVQK